jgi:prepilin-type processing-associated H-X9-DG protein
MRKAINIVVLMMIVAVGGGLLLPFILKARDAAARAACGNKMRQIGLGIFNYHDTYNRLPMATVRSPNLMPENRLSWYADLSPFLEQWFIEFDREKPWDSEENLKPKCHGVETPKVDLDIVPHFLCEANSFKRDEIPNVTHYVGIAGCGKDAAQLPPGYPGVGIFGYDRKTKLQDITDGTSTTMIVAETGWKNGPWTAGGFPTVRGLDPNGMPYLGKNGQFSSMHRSGSGFFSKGEFATNVLFVDGSVRSSAESLDPRIFEAMSTIAGGEKVEITGELLSPRWHLSEANGVEE